ncbi:MAG: hypothetical protein JXR68_08075 [Bacteroidales bacterium]|nr:hypothetical protein [Bacteroidales bacterium]
MKSLLKNSMIIALMITFLSLSFYCTKTNEVAIDENTIAERLNFKETPIIPQEKVIIVRISWDEWGHASNDCNGWGLCNATVEWFPEADEKTINESNYNYSFPVDYDNANNQFYAEILLDEPVPEDIQLQDYPIKVDEEISLNSKEALNDDLKIAIDNYYFDETLGEFGGFRIYLEKK